MRTILFSAIALGFTALSFAGPAAAAGVHQHSDVSAQTVVVGPRGVAVHDRYRSSRRHHHHHAHGCVTKKRTVWRYGRPTTVVKRVCG